MINTLKLFSLCWVAFCPIIIVGQNTISKSGIQNISSGGLWYEYIQHIEEGDNPTIVFESGALSHSGYWDPVIDSIAVYANTIRYDRAGMGQSLQSRDTLHTSFQIAYELNELLDSLDLKDQIYLVCHSIGGFHSRAFAHLFKDKVKAIVFIESPCIEWESMIRSSITSEQNMERDSILKTNRATMAFTARKEYEAAAENRRYLKGIPPVDLPIYILYGGNHSWPADYDSDLFNKNWEDCQDQLSKISSNSQSVYIEHAGHHVFQEFELAKFLFEEVINFE